MCRRHHCKCSVHTDVGIEDPEGSGNLMVKRLSVTVDRTRLKGEVSGARPCVGSRPTREKGSCADPVLMNHGDD